MLTTLLEELKQKLEIARSGIERVCQFPSIKNKINVAIGMRRTGKTFLLFQKMNKLISDDVDFSQILYLNFEDDRLLPMDSHKLSDVIDMFYTLYPDNHQKCVYLFLDEIQNVVKWPNIVRRLFDTKNVEIFLSGSSAKLLSREIATSLRGRSLSVEVYPYEFKEYAIANRITIKPSLHVGKITSDTYRRVIRNFLLKGGFPEIQGTDIPLAMQKRILQDYVNGVVFRDIVERYHISNLPLIQTIIRQLLKNVACALSIHKLYSDLKSQGMKISKNTLHEYMGYVEDAYLAFSIPLFSDSIRKVQSNPKKIYAIDTGLAAAYSFAPDDYLSHLFENLIFLDLKRHGFDIFYYLTYERYEVDFYVKNVLGSTYLFQVTWDMGKNETRIREERALSTAMKELNIKNGMIVTPDNYFEFIKTIQSFSGE